MSRARFMALAASAGIEVEYHPGRRSHPRTGEPVGYEMLLDHPTKVFCGSYCHCDGSLMGNNEITEITPDWVELTRLLRGIIDEGFIDCDDPECDICHTDAAFRSEGAL